MLAKKSGLVTFTFDDGVSKNYTELLDILDAEGIKATFFVIGENLASHNNQLMLADAYNRGHTIGNHTWSHCHDTKVSKETFQDELTTTNDKIKSITGEDTYYFRPPYGEINDAVKQHIIDMGYKLILWNVDAQDWNLKRSSEDMLAYYTDLFTKADNTKSSYIILQHDHRLDSVNLVPQIASIVKSNGFTIVSMDEYLGTNS